MREEQEKHVYYMAAPFVDFFLLAATTHCFRCYRRLIIIFMPYGCDKCIICRLL